jgi:gamma-glutamyltranspeptidase/glutathione hydrolase
VKLARGGFALSADLADSLNRQFRHTDEDQPNHSALARNDFGRMGDYPESIAVFRKSDGSPWRPGDRLVQPDLAATLDRIAAGGSEEFYSGRTARLLARYAAEHGGFITLEDLASYQARLRKPIHTTFRGAEVYSMGPPSSGGVTLCLMLAMLERFDLKADGRDSPRTLHRVTEVMRRAYFVRATQLADPDFVTIPIDRLTSKPYAEELARSIGDHAKPSAELAPCSIEPAEGDHTTHLSVLDQTGNAVALTYTLEDAYGAKCVVAGAGFLLNNEMGDFNLIPGRTDTRGWIGTKANQIQPHKRMLSSQTPTLVLKDGCVQVVTGSPGGRTIPNTTLWVVLNLLEFGMNPRAAVEAPRTHHQWFPDTLTLEGRAWPRSTLAALASLGHRVRFVDHQGNANTIVIEPDTRLGPGAGSDNGRPVRRIHGVPDRRRTTTKASGD